MFANISKSPHHVTEGKGGIALRIVESSGERAVKTPRVDSVILTGLGDRIVSDSSQPVSTIRLCVVSTVSYTQLALVGYTQ